MSTLDPKNNIESNAKYGLANGFRKCSEAIGVTIGPAGTNVIIEEALNPGFRITNDGVTILESISFENQMEELARRILLDAVQRANKQSGDGSTTTTLITSAILAEGVTSTSVAMEIKRSLAECLPIIEKAIDDQTRQITVDDVEHVATISAENPALGKIIADIFRHIGTEGIVELEKSNTFETTYELKDGVRFACGTNFPVLMNKLEYAEYENAPIAVIRQRINSKTEIEKLCNALAATKKKDLVIFYDDMSDGVIDFLIRNHAKGNFNVLLIKAPSLWKDFIYEDFAKAVGATIVSETGAVSLSTMKLEHLGSCEKLRCNKTETTLFGIKDISEHIASLKEKGDDDSMRRVGWLATKGAILRVGAQSEAELSYLMPKAEDAVNAAKMALKGGIVAGGGMCLLNSAKSLPETVGGQILKKALQVPAHQIMKNAGMEPTSFFGFDTLPGVVNGYNAKTGEITDMFAANIVDPALVEKNAVRNAISVASTALTISVGLTRNKTEEEIAMRFIQRQQQW